MGMVSKGRCLQGILHGGGNHIAQIKASAASTCTHSHFAVSAGSAAPVVAQVCCIAQKSPPEPWLVALFLAALPVNYKS